VGDRARPRGGFVVTPAGWLPIRWTADRIGVGSLVQGIYSTADENQDFRNSCGWEARTMTVAELHALEELQIDQVREWRLEELLRVGYTDEDATEIAFHLDIDLHYAAGLVSRGCPSSTAARIVL
jgi:hypothetical protein